MKLDEKLYTQVVNETHAAFNGVAKDTKNGVVIRLTNDDVESIIEELLLTIKNLKDEISDLKNPGYEN